VLEVVVVVERHPDRQATAVRRRGGGVVAWRWWAIRHSLAMRFRPLCESCVQPMTNDKRPKPKTENRTENRKQKTENRKQKNKQNKLQTACVIVKV